MEKYTVEGEGLVATFNAEIKKSKFLSYMYKIKCEQDVQNILKDVKDKNSSAKHIVYAYRLENTGRYTDDKEPAATAGKPIYGMLEKENLVNVLIVVVRYFGGILLGTGPLTRAYLGGATSVLAKCKKVQYVKYIEKSYVVEYAEEKAKTKEILASNGKIIEVIYGEKVKIIAEIPK